MGVVETEISHPDNKVIVVVGRAADFGGFIQLVDHFLFDNYDLINAQPLEDIKGVDGKFRFIGFVSGEEIEGAWSIFDQAHRINQSGGELGATVYEGVEEAMAGAKTKFGYEGSEAYVEQQKARRELLNAKYPDITSEELAFYQVFESLLTTGKISIMRGVLDDETPVSVLVFGVSDESNNMTIQGMALLIDRAEIRHRISLPFDEMED